MEVDGSEDDAAECGTGDAWLLRAWRHVRCGVRELLAQEAAATNTDVKDEEEKQVHGEVATASGETPPAARPSRHISDEALARWMRTVVDW